MRKFKIFSFSLIVFLLMISGCKNLKIDNNLSARKMPEAFASQKDSVNSAQIKWRQYFTDANLVSLIDEAIKNNSDLLIAMQRIEAARSGVGFSKGALFPTVSGNIAYWGRKFGHYTMDDAGNRTTEITPGKMIPTYLPDYYVGLQAGWEIDLWGKLKNKKKGALARYLATIEGRNLVLTNLIADVANWYYELLSLDNQLEIVQQTIKIQENASELIKFQKQAGAANELAVKQFEAQLLNSKIMEVEIRQNITEVESQINFLLNRFPQPITRDKSEFLKAIPFSPKAGIPSDLLKNRPDIKQAEYDLLASHADLKAAKAAFYPSLNITGTLGFQGFRADLLFQPKSLAFSILGGLTAPILNRNAIKAEFKTATASQQEALFNYQKTILNGYIEVYNELALINSLSQIYTFRESEASVMSDATDISSELYKTGRANYLEVLSAQQNALNAKLSLIDVKRQQFNASVNIYRKLGGGWQ